MGASQLVHVVYDVKIYTHARTHARTMPKRTYNSRTGGQSLSGWYPALLAGEAPGCVELDARGEEEEDDVDITDKKVIKNHLAQVLDPNRNTLNAIAWFPGCLVSCLPEPTSLQEVSIYGPMFLCSSNVLKSFLSQSPLASTS